MQSASARLLISATRYFLGTAPGAEVRDHIESVEDWSALARLAAEEGTEGVLVHALEQLHLDHHLPGSRERLLRTLQRNVDYRVLLNTLGSAAARHGFDMLLLKGGALLPRVYAGRVGRRPLRDLDVLVRPADADRLRRVLSEHGFQGRGDVMARGDLTVDVHTSLVSATRIRQRAETFEFDEALLWQASQPLQPDLPAVRILDPAHEFCYLAVHALKHSFSRLIWLVDLALLRPVALDDGFVTIATATRTRRVLTYVFALLDSVLAVSPPQGCEPVMVPLVPFEQRFLRAVQRRDAPEAMGELVTLQSVEGVSARARYLLELCFPRPAVLADTFVDTPGWLLYPRRVSQLLGKAVRERSRLWEMLD